MTKANECTCPSGDGSLRHPCPAHPASVELAGVGAKLTFINGRPAMCGCQVEYSSGGGEYSDVIYVTLCAKHSGSAILDLVATNRIALTPEYEGQWHADLYLDREIPLAKAEGATPAEAVLALMSAERIDPEQESVEQAGGDERDLQGAQGERECGHAACKSLGEHHPFCKFVSDQDRAALAQPSPASDLDPFNLAPHAEAFNEAPDEALRPEQAEAERPVVIARLYRSNDLTMTPFAEVQKPLPMPRSDGTLTVEPLMTVAQHERIVGARWNRAMDLMGEHVARISEKFKAERDAALARVAELEKQELLAAYIVAAPGKEVPQAWLDVQAERRRQVEVEGYHGFRDSHYINYELSKAARAYIEVSWHALSGGLPCKQPESWPWMAGFKWSDGRTMLVKACALTLAEIERLDRAAAPGKEGV